MSKGRVLIVDDDADIRQVVSVLLRSEGYETETAANGQEAILKVLEIRNLDLLILDIMMPGMDGIEVCRKIRKFSNVPVLFLTAKSQDDDKVDAYNQGGDDYIVKPFDQTDLLLKIKSLLRRYNNYQGQAKLERGIEVLSEHVAVDKDRRIATKAGARINLTDKEYAILNTLLEKRGEVVLNRDLYEAVWGEEYSPSAGNKIMVHVLNLRKKIEEDINNPSIVKTVWGKGYRIDK